MVKIEVTALPWGNEYKWVLDETYVHKTAIVGHSIDMKYVKLSKTGMLVIMPGYQWDGASGPTWDTLSCRRGAMVHDALYQLMEYGGLSHVWKDYSDKQLRDICLEDGMWPIRAWIWYQMVRKCGGAAWI